MNTTVMKYINEFNSSNCTSPESTNINWLNEFEYFRFNEDGSFTCKASKQYLKEKRDHSLVLALYYSTDITFGLSGEDGCANNWDMYTPFYNFCTGMKYLVLHSVSDKFMEGEEVTVYGKEVDTEELKEIMEWLDEEC